MDIQNMVKTGRRQEWADMVMRCRHSGLTVVEWCKQEGLSPATYQYRRKQVMDALEEQALPKQNLFVPLTVDTECTVRDQAAITIRMGRIEVAIETGVDAGTLTTVLETIDRLC